MKFIKTSQNPKIAEWLASLDLPALEAEFLERYGVCTKLTAPNRKHMKMFGPPNTRNPLCAAVEFYRGAGTFRLGRYYTGPVLASQAGSLMADLEWLADEYRGDFPGHGLDHAVAVPFEEFNLPLKQSKTSYAVEMWHPAVGDCIICCGYHAHSSGGDSCGVNLIQFNNSGTWFLLELADVNAVDTEKFSAFPQDREVVGRSANPLGPNAQGDSAYYANSEMRKFWRRLISSPSALMHLYYMTKRLQKGVFGWVSTKKERDGVFNYLARLQDFPLPITIYVRKISSSLGAPMYYNNATIFEGKDPAFTIPTGRLDKAPEGRNIALELMHRKVMDYERFAGYRGFSCIELAGDPTLTVGITAGSVTLIDAASCGDPVLHSWMTGVGLPYNVLHAMVYQELLWDPAKNAELHILDCLEPISSIRPVQALLHMQHLCDTLGYFNFITEMGTSKYPASIGGSREYFRHLFMESLSTIALTMAEMQACFFPWVIEKLTETERMLRVMKRGLEMDYADSLTELKNEVNRAIAEIDAAKIRTAEWVKAYTTNMALYTAKEQAGPDMSKIEGLAGLLDAGMITSLSLTKDDLIFRTGKIIGAIPLRGGKMDYRDFGMFEVRLNIKTCLVKFTQLEKSKFLEKGGFWSGGSMHPHINAHGKACMGTLESLLSATIAENDYPAAVHAILGFLSTANIDDSAGQKYNAWPQVNPDGSPYTGDLVKCACGNPHTKESLTDAKCEVCGKHMCAECVSKDSGHYICSNCQAGGAFWNTKTNTSARGESVYTVDGNYHMSIHETFDLASGVGKLCASMPNLHFSSAEARDAYVAAGGTICPTCDGFSTVTQCSASEEPDTEGDWDVIEDDELTEPAPTPDGIDTDLFAV